MTSSSSSRMADTHILEELAGEFADQLTASTRIVAPDCAAFVPSFLSGRSKRITIRQAPREGVPLSVAGAPLIYLTARFRCTWDGAGSFLAVGSSTITAYVGKPGGQPLFRYEYLRDARGVPAAHVHVHAHRDAFTFTMAKAGKESRRSARRVESGDVPSIQDLHFPVGGHRFRPVLEDVLEMLIDEFGVDHDAGALALLEEARERWRLTQTKAAVRDAPEASVDALRELGYRVEWPLDDAEPRGNRTRLRAL